MAAAIFIAHHCRQGPRTRVWSWIPITGSISMCYSILAWWSKPPF